MYSPLNPKRQPKQIEAPNKPLSEPPSSLKEMLQKIILLFFNLSARSFLIIYPVTSFVLRYTLFTHWFLNKTVLLIHYLFYPLAQERDDQDQLSPPRFIHKFLLRTKQEEAQQSLGMDINQNVIEVKATELLEKAQVHQNQEPPITPIKKNKHKAQSSKHKLKLHDQAQLPLIDQASTELQSMTVNSNNSMVDDHIKNAAHQESSIQLQNKSARKDINRATLEDFMEIEGLSKARAEEIIKYRDLHGPFQNIEAVTEVRGIGTKTTFALLARFEVT
jgi:competence ComEA-like helix-hairpin-helix protein